MKKIIITLSLLFVALGVALANDDKPIAADNLPAAAKEFLKTHFPNDAISFVKEDNILFKEYEVVLADATHLEFDNNGEWKDVECKSAGVPHAIVPKQVSDYIARSYAKAKIIKIERDRRGYEISLSNGLEVDFDKNFNVVDIDD